MLSTSSSLRLALQTCFRECQSCRGLCSGSGYCLLHIQLKYFHPTGFFSSIRTTFVKQSGDLNENPSVAVDSDFNLIGGSICYRFPKNVGLVSLEGENLLNEEFQFQDTDPGNPFISSERFIQLKIQFSY